MPGNHHHKADKCPGAWPVHSFRRWRFLIRRKNLPYGNLLRVGLLRAYTACFRRIGSWGGNLSYGPSGASSFSSGSSAGCISSGTENGYSVVVNKGVHSQNIPHVFDGVLTVISGDPRFKGPGSIKAPGGAKSLFLLGGTHRVKPCVGTKGSHQFWRDSL